MSVIEAFYPILIILLALEPFPTSTKSSGSTSRLDPSEACFGVDF